MGKIVIKQFIENVTTAIDSASIMIENYGKKLTAAILNMC